MEPAARFRRSNALAVAAFLLALTAGWLPWWRVEHRQGGRAYDAVDVRLWGDPSPAAFPGAVWLTAGLAAGVAAWLFVRVAARSWEHEPRTWRRDLGILAGLALAALASTLAWPDEVPAFWGRTTYSLVDGSGSFQQAARPVLGWWTWALATALLAWGRWLCRGEAPEAEAARD